MTRRSEANTTVPPVTAVVLSFGRRTDLLLTLEQLHESDYPDLDILVIDNGSPDGTLDGIAERFQGMRLLRLPENLGPCARDYAVSATEAKYIVHFDDDSAPAPNAISKMVDLGYSGSMATDPTKWGVQSLTLQQPEHLYFDGEVRKWDQGVLHVSTEAVVRGLNVFEGLKGHWQAEGGFAWRTIERHYARMTRSARLLHIPVTFDFEEFAQACFDLSKAELIPEKDLYIRATLLVVEGHYGEGTVSDLVLTAYRQEKEPPQPVAVGTSTWRRSPDVSMPARIKTSTNYQIARLARFEGKSRGYDDMILLNQSGRVAEGIGACLLMVRDGRVYTPPTWEGALESITLDAITHLGASMDIEVVRRPVERSELYIADELGLTGSLSDITPVHTVDDFELPEEAPLLAALQQRYRDAVTGVDPCPYVKMTLVPE